MTLLRWGGVNPSGPLVQIQVRAQGGLEYDLDRLLEEISISTNTAAAGGNASLMSMG